MKPIVIQLGHPKIATDSFTEFSSVSDVFLKLFRINEESTFLFWHDIPIQLRYREDLYRNFNDILAMAWLLERDDQGGTVINIQTPLMSINWELRWSNDDLELKAKFTPQMDIYQAYADALNNYSMLKISKNAFLREWHTLLHQIVTAFNAGNVQIEDGTERRKWEMLLDVEKKISGYGELYTRKGRRQA